MNATKVLAAVGAGTLGYLVLGSIGSVAAKNIQISFGRAFFDYIGGPDNLVDVMLPISITNWNYVGIDVYGFQGEIKFGDIELADVYINQQFPVGARKSTTTHLLFRVKGTPLLASAVNNVIQPGGLLGTVFNVLWVKGELQTNIINYPVDQAIQIVPANV